jgi:hypothetical protein
MTPETGTQSKFRIVLRRIKKWLEDYGFGVLVLAAIVAAGFIAVYAELPVPIPDFALKSTSLYRLEIGGASFFIFYLAVVAFVLALNGRGFTSIGPRGVKADQVVRANQVQQQTIKGQEKSIEALERSLERNRTATGLLNQQNRKLRDQVRQLQVQADEMQERLRKLEKSQG